MKPALMLNLLLMLSLLAGMAAAPVLAGEYPEIAQQVQDGAYDYIQWSDDRNIQNGHPDPDIFFEKELALTEFGTLTGQVTDASTSAPIPGAIIFADGTFDFNGTADVNGVYNIIVAPGTYDVTASAFVHQPETANGSTVTAGGTTVQDFSLNPAPTVSVSGYVYDTNTGWPLYASLEIAGVPLPYWSDPVTGYYEIQVPTGGTFDFHVEAWVSGYAPADLTLGPLAGNTTQDFPLDVNQVTCNAPGYTFTPFQDDFEGGYGNWTMDGLWNPEAQADACGSLIAPFPSPTNAAYYGQDGVCNYDTGAANSGSLTMNNPVLLSAGNSMLIFSSYEETECGGDCAFDNREVDISTNGGSTWTTLGEGNTENVWYQRSFDLSAYNGQNVLLRFTFDSSDSIANSFFGWMVDDVSVGSCAPRPNGGLVVGNVYDANTNTALTGAMVENVAGYSALAMDTPDDANVDDAFYTVFSPEGLQQHTATMTGGYKPDVAIVDVADYSTTGQDFYLEALTAAPDTLTTTVVIGYDKTLTMTLSNVGTLTADFTIIEQDKGMGMSPLTATRDFQPDFSAPAAIGPSSVRSAEGQAVLASAGPNAWSAGAPLPASAGRVRYAKAQCADDPDGFYLISGVGEGFSATAESFHYDAASNAWTPLAPFPTPVEGPSGVCYEGFIYVMGGGGTNQFYIYDIAADNWSPGPVLPRNVWGAATGAYAGKVYMMGGDSDFIFGGTSDQVDIYDIAGGTWSTGSAMPSAAVTAGHIQAGQYVYVVGGWDDGSPTANVAETQRYDMAIDSWASGPAFTIAKSDFALAITKDNLYAMGGDADGGGPFDPSDSVYALDHTAWPGGSWTDLSDPLRAPVSANNGGFCTEAMAGGEVWSTGGFAGSIIGIIGTNDYRASEKCFTVPWLSENPITGTIAAGGSQVIDVHFDASVPEVTGPGTYEAELIIFNNTPYGPLKIPVTMNVVPVPYGVNAALPQDALSGTPGTTLTYKADVTNTANVPDTFDITVGGNAWMTTAPPTVGPLGPGVTAVVDINVTIPAGAADGASDSATVTFTSQGNASESDQVVTTSTAVHPKINLPVIPQGYSPP